MGLRGGPMPNRYHLAVIWARMVHLVVSVADFDKYTLVYNSGHYYYSDADASVLRHRR